MDQRERQAHGRNYRPDGSNPAHRTVTGKVLEPTRVPAKPPDGGLKRGTASGLTRDRPQVSAPRQVVSRETPGQ
jgi:hypothetical protein